MPDGPPASGHRLTPDSHRLDEADFDALADSAGTRAGIEELRLAERSRHILLVWEVLKSAADQYPTAYTDLRLHAAFQLLARAQECEPDTVARILSLPGVGAWAVDCLVRLGQRDHADTAVRTDLAQFDAIAATAGLLTGQDFVLPVRLRDGRLMLPGFGRLDTSLSREYALLSHSAAGTALLEDGAEHELPLPLPLPLRSRLVITHANITLDVNFEVSDPYLNWCLRHPRAHLDEVGLASWPDRIAGAWRILAGHHPADATAIAALLDTVVPLTTGHATHLVSATSPAAFGAIATSLPPDDVTLAETLVHECQHLKLCALLDLFPMVQDDARGLYYAPWRDDPRPIRGLLQGAFAYLGVTRFWRQQRHYGSPGQALRGHVEFARRRSETLSVTGTLLHSGGLTAVGTRFATGMHARLLGWRHDPVPAGARRMAAEVSADHAALWRLRHLVCDPDLADRLAKSWLAGTYPDGAGGLPAATLQVSPAKTYDHRDRGFLLTLRYTDPERFRALLDEQSGKAGSLELSAGDLSLLRGDHAAAVAAYQTEIRHGDCSFESWAGLITAAQTTKGNRVFRTLLTWAPLLFAIHSRIINVDPVELAAWLAESHFGLPEWSCQ